MMEGAARPDTSIKRKRLEISRPKTRCAAVGAHGAASRPFDDALPPEKTGTFSGELRW